VNKFRREFGALTTSAFRKPVLPDVSTKGNIRSANPERVRAENCQGTTRLVRDNPTSTDGKVAGSAKRLAARFYQLKVGHCLTGEYLHWTKSRPTPQCWWCRCPKQTRHHLLKRCPRWKKELRTLWEEVYKETGRGRGRWKAHELFAESECS